MRILAVEDEKELASMIQANLARQGFVVDVAATLHAGLAHIEAQRYDAVLLDLTLPDGDGRDLLRVLGSRKPPPPVIAVTARDLVRDRVTGLNDGADDYVVKPFALEELTARLRAVLRRAAGAGGGILTVGDLVLDMGTRQVTVGPASLILPRRELAALDLLLRSAGRVVTRARLSEKLYSAGEEPNSNAVDANISRLRRRLKEAGSRTSIHVIRGLGYMLRDGA